jgi:hypothetical protein
MTERVCPFCGSATLGLEGNQVQCLECYAMGPLGRDGRSAMRAWSKRPVVEDEPDIRLEESPGPEGHGSRMAVYYGDEELADVDYVHERFAATLRGALMLIGGMAKAEELEKE